MTRTPTPRAPGVTVFICDHCGKVVEASEYVSIPNGWEIVTIRGWVGEFQVCSDKCASNLDPK